ncbi:MAG: hypothetical protein LBD27_07295 [Tannerella sp.]|jgi:hypothetical protein|nr:hypothetical protein [Tannerella sp.]
MNYEFSLRGKNQALTTAAGIRVETRFIASSLLQLQTQTRTTTVETHCVRLWRASPAYVSVSGVHSGKHK